MTSTTVASSGATLDPAFVDEFSQRWLAAWNAHDGEAVTALCTEDVEFFDPAIGTVHGRPKVAEWVRIVHRAFPDARFEEPEPAYLSREIPKAIAPWRMTGTNTGPIDPPGLAPTGKAVVLEGVDHWWFRDGLVARNRADYDSTGFSVQLGLMPARGSRGEKAMAAMQRAGTRLKGLRR